MLTCLDWYFDIYASTW